MSHQSITMTKITPTCTVGLQSLCEALDLTAKAGYAEI